ncbi:unnamed protein product [Caretta caretta]
MWRRSEMAKAVLNVSAQSPLVLYGAVKPGTGGVMQNGTETSIGACSHIGTGSLIWISMTTSGEIGARIGSGSSRSDWYRERCRESDWYRPYCDSEQRREYDRCR